MSRPHPFDLVFSHLADTAFPEIRAEAQDPAMDLSTLARLPSSQRLLGELGSPDLAEENPAVVGEYLALLFVAYRYWLVDAHTLSVDRDKLGAAIERGPQGTTVVPHDACYVALPEHWCWATIGEGQPHEPLDGMFVVKAKGRAEITIVAILGLRPGREGFSQITVTGSADDVSAASKEMRNPPFAPLMEGGTEAGFKSVTSEGELLLLAHLALESAGE
jgi:hypothetical protein